MSQKLIVLLLFLCAGGVMVNAQRSATGSIQGKLLDTSSSQILKAATISLLNTTDSSLISYTISDDDGMFKLDKVDQGTYLLQIVYQGYAVRHRKVTISADKLSVNLGNIYLKALTNTLEDVVVKSSPPIMVKKDTVEFNAGSFTTKPNAVAEDLLKKLPGVDVDKDGNVKAQGEQVQRILVDGKRFFGDDPKMATKNLPPDVIDKIQVFDALSDQSSFTGFDDGNRVKTINIITKKDKRKGYFGKAVAGVGNKELYDNNFNINRFNGNQQMSVIGQANNTNKQSFSVQDILGTFNNGAGGGRGYGGRGGGGSSSGSNNNGLTTTWALGGNYRDVWGKSTDAYGSYFYNNIRTNREQKSLTENLYPNDSSIFNNSDAVSVNRNINQRFNFNIETQFDSANSMIIRPNGSYQQTSSSSSSVTTSVKGKSLPLSNSSASTNQQNNGYNGSIDLLFRHKFAKRGRSFSIDLNFGGSSNDGEGRNFSNNTYIVNGRDSVHNINQRFDTRSNGQSFSPTLSYTEPVGKHSIVELNYNFNYNKNSSDRFTYNYDSVSEKYLTLDSLLTNTYRNTYYSNRATLNYRYQKDNFNFSIGSGVQFGNLTSDNESKNISLTQHYTNLYPTANLNYRFSRTSNLRFNYSGRTAQPSAQQLQPVIDNSDPLNIKMGNPDLKQSFTHSFRLLYNSFNTVTQKNMFLTLNASFISNNIVNATKTILSTGVDSIKPVNLNGNYSISAYFNYGFPIKSPKSNLNFATNLSHSRSVSLITTVQKAGDENGKTQQNTTNNYTLGETIKWTTNLKDNFDMNFSATPTYNIAKYSVQPGQNANYFSQVLSVEATYYTKSGWILGSDFNHTLYSGRAQGYNTSVPLWNASIAKQFLKNKAGELRLSVFDLLNQNVSITTQTTENYIQSVQNKVLTRYVLLTFTYNLRNFAGAQGQRMPGFFRGNRGDRGGSPWGGGGGGFRRP
jgi:hypothetical protein